MRTRRVSYGYNVKVVEGAVCIQVFNKRSLANMGEPTLLPFEYLRAREALCAMFPRQVHADLQHAYKGRKLPCSFNFSWSPQDWTSVKRLANFAKHPEHAKEYVRRARKSHEACKAYNVPNPEGYREKQNKIIREAEEALGLLNEKPCVRCEGQGHLDDREHWVVITETGRKTCFRCKGSGTEPSKE